MNVQMHGADDERVHRFIAGVVASFRQQPRSPILATPSSKGLEFENVTFPSEDGVPLEAWFVPRAGSRKLVIANYPTLSRA